MIRSAVFVLLSTAIKICFAYDGDDWLCRQPALPLLYIAGEEDPCIKSVHAWKKAMALMRQVGYRDIQYRLYPHARHELLNERCQKQVLTEMTAWIDTVAARVMR